MYLVSAVAAAAKVNPDEIMLIRHSNSTVERLLSFGGTVEEYTAVQPTGSKYDYLHPSEPKISIVVVIVNDCVHGVFRVLGVEREGTSFTLTSSAHRRFDEARDKAERPARRFKLEVVETKLLGLAVRGWEKRSRTPVQRCNGGFFWEIEVDVFIRADELLELLDQEVQAALRDSPIKRRARLASSPVMPKRVEVVSFVFRRNPDVIAEVLMRAQSLCEICGAAAPFIRRSQNTPYLEVHHRIRLADGGQDTVENAIATCSNCHRREHYG